MRKIKITSNIAHFKIPYSSKYQKTYDIPPISTVVGILKVLFGEDIDNFKFGYTFKYESKFEDAMNISKVNINDVVTLEDPSTNKRKVTDNITREYLYDCTLLIYTDIELPIEMNYCLTMGRSNSLARVHFPFKPVQLLEEVGQGFNQYTPIELGLGMIKPITYYSEFDKKSQSFNTKVKHLRLNKHFDYDRNYDKEEDQNIFLWKYQGGEIYELN
ncbi:CRISPR-associated protein Cas5 [Tissierella carlieri]|uniref:CRISPR-associated protein Cas5 n=1 Tax=Tissierella carlieri TaxID=689904 RepID=A0ABT1SEY8_9FIRM|nr:CRISPR-associated protein Cas5 [Tissierella carlieri]